MSKRTLPGLLAGLILLAPLGAGAGVAQAAVQAAVAGAAYERIADGVIVTPSEGEARRVRLQVYGPETIRVTATPDANLDLPASIMVVNGPTPTPFEVEQAGDLVRVKTAETTAEVSTVTGAVRFLNAAGEVVLAERC